MVRVAIFFFLASQATVLVTNTYLKGCDGRGIGKREKEGGAVIVKEWRVSAPFLVMTLSSSN